MDKSTRYKYTRIPSVAAGGLSLFSIDLYILQKFEARQSQVTVKFDFDRTLLLARNMSHDPNHFRILRHTYTRTYGEKVEPGKEK